jgi:hypothetical protein
MNKAFLWAGMVAVAAATAACGGAQGSPASPSSGGGPLTRAAVRPQGTSNPCTPPPGADTQEHTGPGTPGGSGESGCQTGTGSGPGTSTGGTPPANPGAPPDTQSRPGPNG